MRASRYTHSHTHGAPRNDCRCAGRGTHSARTCRGASSRVRRPFVQTSTACPPPPSCQQAAPGRVSGSDSTRPRAARALPEALLEALLSAATALDGAAPADNDVRPPCVVLGPSGVKSGTPARRFGEACPPPLPPAPPASYPRHVRPCQRPRASRLPRAGPPNSLPRPPSRTSFWRHGRIHRIPGKAPSQGPRGKAPWQGPSTTHSQGAHGFVGSTSSRTSGHETAMPYVPPDRFMA